MTTLKKIVSTVIKFVAQYFFAIVFIIFVGIFVMVVSDFIKEEKAKSLVFCNMTESRYKALQQEKGTIFAKQVLDKCDEKRQKAMKKEVEQFVESQTNIPYKEKTK